MEEKELIFMDHDGSVDDLLSLLLLMTMKDKEVIGINVTPADCYIEPATESTYKILQLFEKESIPIGRADSYGINAFPSSWRARPEIVNSLPLLINLPQSPNPYDYKEASDLLIQKLMGAPKKVSILITGPCTNVVKAIKQKSQITNQIKQIIWMAGAFRTKGNCLKSKYLDTFF